MKKINPLHFLYFFTIMFPYVSLISTGTDIKPWAPLFAVVYLVIARVKLRYIVWSICVLLFGTLILGVISDQAQIFRAAFSVLTALVIFFASRDIFARYETRKLFSIFAITFLVWIFVGILQLLIDPNVFEIIVHWGDRVWGSVGYRGVPSLSPEPTYFGTILMMFILLFLNFDRQCTFLRIRRNGYILLAFFSMLLLSKSSTAIAIAFLFFGIWVLENLKLSMKMVPWVVFGFFLLVITYMLVDFSLSRMFNLFLDLKRVGPGIVLLDVSVNARITHVLFSFKSIFNCFPVPSLVCGDFHDYMSIQRDLFPNLLFRDVSWSKGPIMSGLGSLVYSFGVIGVFIVCYWVFLALKFGQRRIRWTGGVTLVFFALSATPLGLSYFSVILALMKLHQDRRTNQHPQFGRIFP